MIKFPETSYLEQLAPWKTDGHWIPHPCRCCVTFLSISWNDALTDPFQWLFQAQNICFLLPWIIRATLLLVPFSKNQHFFLFKEIFLMELIASQNVCEYGSSSEADMSSLHF